MAIRTDDGNTAPVVTTSPDVAGGHRPDVVTIPVAGSQTDRSSTITTGGTSQQVMAANSSRKYLFFQNVSDTDMWINFGTAAVATQPSIYVKTLTGYVLEGSFVDTQALNVLCATTGKAYTAKEA
ncbi:MAG: hypothetical protein Q7T33_02625 [Dehalococcoidia bacterium]|nr:hypothetical protein [Dehalococcoidia bacterium]